MGLFWKNKNKPRIARMNVKLRRFRVTIVAVEKQ
jgi:hypothetical protein